MPELSFEIQLPGTADAMFDWHVREGAFARLAPPWDPLRILLWEGIKEGSRHAFSIKVGGLPVTWEGVIDRFEPKRVFRDIQLKGPFTHWRHTHKMSDQGDGCSLIDHIDYSVPLGAMGEMVGGSGVRQRVEATWRWRHHRMRWDFARHAKFADQGTKTVAVSGATGFVGTRLVEFLRSGGHRVLRLVRKPSDHPDDVQWRPSEGTIDAKKLEGIDAMVHLAGAPINATWNDENMARIRSSRVLGTALLAKTLAGLERKPEVFISGSAIGIYGFEGGDTELREDAEVGGGFAASVCSDWEAASHPIRDTGIRLVNPRIGVVMAPFGGALQQTLPPFRMGIGGPIGGGAQYFPWVAIDDLLAQLHFAIFTPSLSGPVNCQARESVAQGIFASTLGSVLGRPAFFPTPGAVLRAGLGEMATELVLGGQNAVPQVLLDAGFVWEAGELDGALRGMLGVG